MMKSSAAMDLAHQVINQFSVPPNMELAEPIWSPVSMELVFLAVAYWDRPEGGTVRTAGRFGLSDMAIAAIDDPVALERHMRDCVVRAVKMAWHYELDTWFGYAGEPFEKNQDNTPGYDPTMYQPSRRGPTMSRQILEEMTRGTYALRNLT